MQSFVRVQLKRDGTRWRREGKWRGNWRIQWVTSTLNTTSEHGVSSITTADAHTSAASSRLNWRPCRIKWTHTFRRKAKSAFCACANTFQTQSTSSLLCLNMLLIILFSDTFVLCFSVTWQCGFQSPYKIDNIKELRVLVILKETAETKIKLPEW